MWFLKALSVVCAIFVLSVPAQAQIISQTPRPEIVNPEEELIETVKPNMPVARPGTSVRIPRTGALLFAGFDRNDDYMIDRAEVSAGIERAFKRADKDSSGTISLVELEIWRLAALGSESATPTNFAFAPNFARTVSHETFTAVLSGVAENLDKDTQGEIDGMISMADLLKNYVPRRTRKGENCGARIREERRKNEQQCRSQRGY